jgi:hypothetical protein
MRSREWIGRHVAGWHVLVGGWLVFLVYCFPGYMSYDSGVQLEQARGLQPMTNWHPPVMAHLWKLCDAIIAGPFLMLVLQSGALLVGMYLILRRQLSERGAALAAALILISPPVITPMGVIWKDSQMAGFLMLGIALLARQTRASIVAGCVLVWLGTAQRHNAAAATLPILVLLFVWKDGIAGWRRYALAGAVWLAITISAAMANSLLAEQNEDVFASLAMNDIVGVIRFQPGYTDADVRADAPGLPWKQDTDLVKRAHKLYAANMTWLDVAGEDGVFWYPKTPEHSAAVAAAWRNMILEHPLAYLRHRVSVFLAELRITKRHNFYIWAAFTDYPDRSARLKHDASFSWMQLAWIDALVLLAHTPVYWAWIYYVLGLILVWLCRRDRVALTVAVSGIMCQSGLFIAAPAIDYRYSHWMVTCTIVAAVYHAAVRIKARTAARELATGRDRY